MGLLLVYCFGIVLLGSLFDGCVGCFVLVFCLLFVLLWFVLV